MQYVLATLAALLGAYYFRKRFSFLSALLWIVLFSLARFTIFYIHLFLNVSSMIVFTVVAFMCILKIFSDQEETERVKAYYLSSIVIGLGIQFHFSLISLFAAVIFMFLFSKKLDLKTIPLKKILLGIFILIAPSIPYLVWAFFSRMGKPFGVAAFYNGQSDEALESILYLLKIGLGESPLKIFSAWIDKIIFTTPYVLVAILISHFVFTKVNRRPYIQNFSKIKPLVICLLFAFIPHFNWYFSTQGMRYSMPFYLGLIFATIYFFNSVTKSAERIKFFNVTAGILQIVLLIVMYHYASSEKLTFYLKSTALISAVVLFFYFLIESNEKKQIKGITISILLFISLTVTQKNLIYNNMGNDGYMPSSADWKNTWEIIYSQTGWNYEEARDRVYYIGHHVNQAPQLFLKGDTVNLKIKNTKNIPDGFFVSNRFKKYVDRRSKKLVDPVQWLLKQNLQKNVLEGLKDGDIKVGENLSPRTLILPYWIINKEILPTRLHNTGEGYNLSEEDLLLEKVADKEGIKKIGENEYLFKWNESPDQHAFCSTGAIVDIKKLDTKNYNLNIRIIGGAISQISPWVSPNWTQAWISPYVKIVCGKKEQNFLVADSIGFRRIYTHSGWTPFFSGNNSLVAPIEKNIQFSCNDPLKSVELGRTGSEVEKIKSVKKLEPKYLSLNF